jgi:hypothetical protein
MRPPIRFLCLAILALLSSLSASADVIDTFTLTFNTPTPISSSPDTLAYNFTQLVWTINEPLVFVDGFPIDDVPVFVPGFTPTLEDGSQPMAFAIGNFYPGGGFDIGWQNTDGLIYSFTENGPSIVQGTASDPTFAAGNYTFTSGNIAIYNALGEIDVDDFVLNTTGDTLTVTKQDVPDSTVPEPNTFILLGTASLLAGLKLPKAMMP